MVVSHCVCLCSSLILIKVSQFSLHVFFKKCNIRCCSGNNNNNTEIPSRREELNKRRQFISQLSVSRNQAHDLAVASLAVPNFNLREIQRERFRLSVEHGDNHQSGVDQQILKIIKSIIEQYTNTAKARDRPQTPPPPSNINWNESRKTTGNRSPAMQKRMAEARDTSFHRQSEQCFDNEDDQFRGRSAQNRNENIRQVNRNESIRQVNRSNERNHDLRMQNSQSFHRNDNFERNDNQFSDRNQQNVNRNENVRQVNRNNERDERNDSFRGHDTPNFERNDNYRQAEQNFEQNDNFRGQLLQTVQRSKRSREENRNVVRNDRHQSQNVDRNDNFRRTGRNLEQNDNFRVRSRESFQRNDNYPRTERSFERYENIGDQQSQNFERNDNFRQSGRSSELNDNFQGLSRDDFERDNNFPEAGRNFQQNDNFCSQQPEDFQGNSNFSNIGRNNERNDNFRGQSRDSFERYENFDRRERSIDRNEGVRGLQFQNYQQTDRFRDDDRNFERNDNFDSDERESEYFDNILSRLDDDTCRNPNNENFGFNQRNEDGEFNFNRSSRFENEMQSRNFRGNFENSNLNNFDQDSEDFRMGGGNFQANNNRGSISVRPRGNDQNNQRFSNFEDDFRNRQRNFRQNDSQFYDTNDLLNNDDRGMSMPDDFGPRPDFNRPKSNDFEDRFTKHQQNFDCNFDRGNCHEDFNDRSLRTFNNCDEGQQNWNNSRSNSHYSADNNDSMHPNDLNDHNEHMHPINQRNNNLPNRQNQGQFMGISNSQMNRAGSATFTSTGQQNCSINNNDNNYKRRAASRTQAPIPAKKKMGNQPSKINAPTQALLPSPEVESNNMRSIALPNTVAAAKLNGKQYKLVSNSTKHINNLNLISIL